MADIYLSAETTMNMRGPAEEITWALFCNWNRTNYEPLPEQANEITLATLEFLGEAGKLANTIENAPLSPTVHIPALEIVDQSGEMIGKLCRLLDAWQINPLESLPQLELIDWSQPNDPSLAEISKIAKEGDDACKIVVIRNTALTMLTSIVRAAPVIIDLNSKLDTPIDVNQQIQNLICTITVLTAILHLIGSSVRETLEFYVRKTEGITQPEP